MIKIQINFYRTLRQYWPNIKILSFGNFFSSKFYFHFTFSIRIIYHSTYVHPGRVPVYFKSPSFIKISFLKVSATLHCLKIQDREVRHRRSLWLAGHKSDMTIQLDKDIIIRMRYSYFRPANPKFRIQVRRTMIRQN